jgi:signal transduction histidine kinase
VPACADSLTECAQIVQDLVSRVRRLSLNLMDEGRGFTALVPTTACTGLTGMHECVTLLGGVFHVSSVPGEGTTVAAQIPLRASEGPNP